MADDKNVGVEGSGEQRTVSGDTCPLPSCFDDLWVWREKKIKREKEEKK